MVLFADDAKMFCRIDTQVEIESFQNDINKLCEWSVDWTLAFNTSKCKILQLGNDPTNHIFEMSEGEIKTDIAYVQKEKDLGITIDSQLKFKAHIGIIVAKANQMLGLIKRGFDHMGKEVFLNLYKSLVRPHLEFRIWKLCVVTFNGRRDKIN